MAEEQGKAQSQSSRSARSTPRGGVKRPTPAGTPSPTRSIQVGREHMAISGAILRAIQRKAASAGVELDVGEIPEYSEAATGSEDPARAAKLLAHAVARGMDRFGPLRKLSRHLEGSENRAGIVSDLTSGAYELYVRNQEQVEKLLREYVANVNKKRTTRQAEGTGNGAHVGRSRFSRQQAQPQPNQEAS